MKAHTPDTPLFNVEKTGYGDGMTKRDMMIALTRYYPATNVVYWNRYLPAVVKQNYEEAVYHFGLMPYRSCLRGCHRVDDRSGTVLAWPQSGLR